MHPYGVRDVEKLLRLPRSTIRALIAAGFVSPARGPRRAWRFSFRDLIVLRTAQALSAARVPHRRITQSVRELRRHLPDAMPLSGLAICAVGDRVAVREGASRWQADSGQYLLAFEGDPAAGSLNVVATGFGGQTPGRSAAGGLAPGPGGLTLRRAQDWFEQGIALEKENPAAALQAYQRAVSAVPSHLDARVNLGRLLHECGRHAEAERAYRDAAAACGHDPVLFYNLGVLLEDMDRKRDAMEAYETALRGDPGLADCHYNLALLYEGFRRQKDAIRHMAQYRRLTRK